MSATTFLDNQHFKGQNSGRWQPLEGVKDLNRMKLFVDLGYNKNRKKQIDS